MRRSTRIVTAGEIKVGQEIVGKGIVAKKRVEDDSYVYVTVGETCHYYHSSMPIEIVKTPHWFDAFLRILQPYYPQLKATK